MSNSQQENIFDRLPVVEVFDCLVDTVFFVKGLQGEYVLVNEALVTRSGYLNKSQLIGKTPSDVLGKKLGKSYEGQDQFVLSSGAPIMNQLEMHIYRNRNVGWCMTNKRAVFSKDNKVIGVVGVSQDLRPPNMSHDDFSKITPVLAYVRNNLSQNLSLKTLAELVSLSSFQLDRRINSVFGLTTGQWVLQNRLDLARRELIETQNPVAEIALNCGYADQSIFARQFKKTTGLSPSHFRAIAKEG